MLPVLPLIALAAAAGFALGVVASPSRDVLRTRGPWLSAALAIAVGPPADAAPAGAD